MPEVTNGKICSSDSSTSNPAQAIRNPIRVVTNIWPDPATAVTAKVRRRDQPRAFPTKTNATQWVGIAACRNATVNPVMAMVSKAVSFIG